MRTRARLGLVVVTVLVAGGCSSTTTPQPTVRGDKTPVSMDRPSVSIGQSTAGAGLSAKSLPSYSNAKAMLHVRKLAGRIGVRVRSKPGELAGARYIRKKFEAFGYKTKVQTFSVDGGTSRNVVARWPGSGRSGLVVGAHMDTVPGAPGANDNASGVAVMLEMARISAGRDPVHFVRFVAFGSEEYGTNGKHHVGSQVYVNRLGKRGRRRLGGMISVDMIADGRPLITGTAGIGPEVVARTVFNRLRKKVRMSYQTMCDCSDNGPFERAGIPATFLYSGNEPNYHDPSDTPNNLKKKDLRRTGLGVRFLFRHIDGKMIRRFRRGR